MALSLEGLESAKKLKQALSIIQYIQHSERTTSIVPVYTTSIKIRHPLETTWTSSIDFKDAACQDYISILVHDGYALSFEALDVIRHNDETVAIVDIKDNIYMDYRMVQVIDEIIIMNKKTKISMLLDSANIEQLDAIEQSIIKIIGGKE